MPNDVAEYSFAMTLQLSRLHLNEQKNNLRPLMHGRGSERQAYVANVIGAPQKTDRSCFAIEWNQYDLFASVHVTPAAAKNENQIADAKEKKKSRIGTEKNIGSRFSRIRKNYYIDAFAHT